jgi:cyclopropane-fatty-acyl-phospholipid synthase
MSAWSALRQPVRALQSRGIRQPLERLAETAGITLDGRGPAAVRIFDDRVFHAAATRGFAGLRDAYVEGWWDAEQLDIVTERVLSCTGAVQRAGRAENVRGALLAWAVNRQAPAGNARSAQHYQLGNDLYEAMLDRRMVYSCAYWRAATTLDDAQQHKLDLVCRKLGLERGMRLLDVGCGWGGLARHAAEHHGVSVVGITIAPAQAELARARCAGLPVEVRVQDYRDLARGRERFDRVASLGMFEHVGARNGRRYMRMVHEALAPGGLALVQTIGVDVARGFYDPWMDANIFPNAMIPSASQLAAAAEGLLVVEDWQNLGADYHPTLVAWFRNFEAAWPKLRARYGERFYRMWKCYLLTCAGGFRARRQHVWQIVLSRGGVRGGYTAAR